MWSIFVWKKTVRYLPFRPSFTNVIFVNLCTMPKFCYIIVILSTKRRPHIINIILLTLLLLGTWCCWYMFFFPLTAIFTSFSFMYFLLGSTLILIVSIAINISVQLFSSCAHIRCHLSVPKWLILASPFRPFSRARHRSWQMKRSRMQSSPITTCSLNLREWNRWWSPELVPTTTSARSSEIT